MGSRVFVPMVPSTFNKSINDWLPNMNIQPAGRYGKVHIMLPFSAVRMATAPMVDVLKESMEDFGEGDYLLAVGDPSIIAAAAAIATKKTGGRLQLLKWDRMMRDYIVVELSI